MQQWPTRSAQISESSASDAASTTDVSRLRNNKMSINCCRNLRSAGFRKSTLVAIRLARLAQHTLKLFPGRIPFESIWLCAQSARGATACSAKIFTSLIAWFMPKSKLAIRLLNSSVGIPANLSGKNSMRCEMSLIYCWHMLGIYTNYMLSMKLTHDAASLRKEVPGASPYPPLEWSHWRHTGQRQLYRPIRVV